jgi:hypothetical protein
MLTMIDHDEARVAQPAFGWRFIVVGEGGAAAK